MLVFVWQAVPVMAQEDVNTTTRSVQQVPLQRTNSKPPELLPQREATAGLRGIISNEYGVATDTLTDAQILRRLSRLYRYQADILAAQVEDDSEHTEGLLELAMTELGTLSQQPGIMARPRYRELYRTLVTEYERYYGVSDTVLTIPHEDIFQLRADMFAALNTVNEPLLEDVMLPTLEPMPTTVPMTVNRLVERSIQFLLQERKVSVEKWRSRSDTYFPMIEQILAEEGVPDEMKYLAVIESTLNPRAASWAHAVGMWQFIAATGRSYGLEVNSWVDERMDPEKATRAAAKHLKDLYEMYNQDWHLAIAGYNCSPRCIRRAMRQSGKANPTYWDVYDYLPRETRNYVPMFIATALVMSNPGAFDLGPAPKGPEYAYDLVPVQGMLSLDDVAEMAGTTTAMIKALNPELRRNILPPTNGAYMLRIPLGSYDRFAAAFETLPDSKKRGVDSYTVRRGDSLGKIATQFGVSVAMLKEANGLGSNTIHPGQHLIVPVARMNSDVSLADAQPLSVQYGARRIRPLAPAQPLAVATATPETSTPVRTASASGPSVAPAEAEPAAAEAPKTTETRIVYQVRRGDSLSKIAAKYGVSVSDIRQWNNIRGSRINSGQRLYLYTSNTPAEPERVVYRVKRGDNLTAIANQYGVSVASIRSWNNLRSNTIQPGQRLTIHPGQSAPSYVTHTVRRGESLGKIASRYGVSVTNLKRWNDLRRNTIHPGQRLKVYR